MSYCLDTSPFAVLLSRFPRFIEFLGTAGMRSIVDHLDENQAGLKLRRQTGNPYDSSLMLETLVFGNEMAMVEFTLKWS